VYSLETGEAADIRNHLQNFVRQGIQKVVLDLRGVATGSIDEAAAVANLFIRQGDLAKIVGRENKVIKTFTADPAKAIFDGKVNVLIDLGTAGPGEVVASAILEAKRGEVVGEKSFGAGVEQQLFRLRNGDGYLLTVAKWASGSGKPFLTDDRATTGVKPSVEVKRPDTPEPDEVDQIVNQQDQQNQNPQPAATPAAEKSPAPADDIQLRKAIELLSDKKPVG
jgi:carboxyl-terminal processing protease